MPKGQTVSLHTLSLENAIKALVQVPMKVSKTRNKTRKKKIRRD